MRIRTVVTGVITGLVCTIVLWLYFYFIGLPKYIPGWAVDFPLPSANPGLPLLVLSLCGVALFTAGWVSARWNWANSWQSSISVGASAGLLASFLIYDFFGAIWSTFIGQTEALANIFNQIGEEQGIRIFIKVMVDTNRAIYGNFIWVVLACTAMGMLGGFVSALLGLNERWGTPPRNPEGWLFRLPVYLLVFFGFFNLTGTFALLGLLTEFLAEAPTGELNYSLAELIRTIEQLDFMQSTYLVGWYFTLLPAGLIAGWFIRLIQSGGRITLPSFSGLTLMAIILLLAGRLIAPGMFSLRGVFSTLVLALIVATLIAGWVGLITRDEAEGFRYHTSDWLGFLLGYGIMGGTQLIMGILVYGISLIGLTGLHIERLSGGGIFYPATITNYIYRFFIIQGVLVIAAMILASLIAFIIANLVAFSRSVFDIRETYFSYLDEEIEVDEEL